MAVKEETQSVTLKILGNGYEIIISGNLTELETELEKLESFSKKVQTIFKSEVGQIQKTQGQGTEKTPLEVSTPTDESPSIKATKSTIDNIRLMFNSEWGKKPRSISEVMKALEMNAVPESDKYVSTVLMRLVQAGELKRIGERKNYQYYKRPEG